MRLGMRRLGEEKTRSSKSTSIYIHSATSARTKAPAPMLAIMAPANVLPRLPDCLCVALPAEHAPVDELLSSLNQSHLAP